MIAVAEMFVLYERQPDYPGAIVVRRFTLSEDSSDFVMDGGTPMLLCADVGSARFLLNQLRSGLMPVELEGDERVQGIAEVWWRIEERDDDQRLPS